MSPKPTAGHFQGVSPVLLSSACDVLAGNSAIPDSGQLSYPFRKAIWIDEIRWSLRMAPPNGAGSAFDLGALVYARMQLGQHYLMRNPVPIWLPGTTTSSFAERYEDADLTTVTTFSEYRWKLPSPLYVEAGQVLSSVFSRGADGLPSINVQVTYVGRTVAPNQQRPRVIAVPYVAPWVTAIGGVGASGYQQSNEFDLFNPFSAPLQVQRLTGRVANYYDANTIARSYDPTPATPGSAITVLMDDSWGGKMVGSNTGPADVFDALRAAWTVDSLMPAKGIYTVRAWNIPSTKSLHIGMIGTREESI